MPTHPTPSSRRAITLKGATLWLNRACRECLNRPRPRYGSSVGAQEPPGDPLAHVVGAEVEPEIAQGWREGIRAPGTHVPGVITAGTFYQDGERVFWDVHHPEKTVVIRLRDERYARLVIEVDDPRATAAAIQGALGER